MNNIKNEPLKQKKINAMIFAAGLGSRLKPLTNSCPKALVKIAGTPLLKIALNKMERLGISRVIVNIHHHAEQMIDFLNRFQSTSMEVVISDERNQLMDTGGGLLTARHLFEPQASVLLYNVDILTNADLRTFINFHLKNNNPVSLMIKRREASRYLLFDEKMHLTGWEKADGSEQTLIRTGESFQSFGFQGIHIVSPYIFEHMNKTGPFPIVPFYLQLAKILPVIGCEYPNADWFDVGNPEKLARAESFLKDHSGSEYPSFM